MEENKVSKNLWRTPEIIVTDLKELEEAIITNARSGCNCGCTWSVGCKILL